MDIARIFRHLSTTRAAVRRRFPPASLQAIETAISEAESQHRGEIRFAIEAALAPSQVMAGISPRERALEVFSTLRVWDTEANSGVLVYLLYADHAIEIVADRGIHAAVGEAAWEGIAAGMEGAFAAGDYLGGVLRGIGAVSGHMRQHLPRAGDDTDELPGEVVLL